MVKWSGSGVLGAAARVPGATATPGLTCLDVYLAGLGKRRGIDTMTQDFQSCAHLRATDPGDSPQTMLFRFLSARELNRRFRATFTLGLGD